MLLSQDAFKRKKEKEHLFMRFKPRTFGATQKSLFNMLHKTLFMCVVYDTSQIYMATKRQSEKDQNKLCHI